MSMTSRWSRPPDGWIGEPPEIHGVLLVLVGRSLPTAFDFTSWFRNSSGFSSGL